MSLKSSDFVSPSKKNQEEKEMLLLQLKEENIELKNQEREYFILNSSYQDLIQKISILKEERKIKNVQALERESLHDRTLNNLRADLSTVKNSLDSKNLTFLNFEKELIELKELVSKTNSEISKIKGETKTINELSSSLIVIKRKLENDLATSYEKKEKLQKEIDLSIKENQLLLLSKSKKSEEIKILEYDYLNKGKNLISYSDEQKLLEAERGQLQTSVMIEQEANLSQQKEAYKLQELNFSLINEKNKLEEKASILEIQMNNLRTKILDTNNLIVNKENEIKNAKTTLSYTEYQNIESKLKLEKLKKENESIDKLQKQYREDANLNKRLRDQQISKSIQLENEKNQIQEKVKNKEIESSIARLELQRIEDAQKQLLEDHYFLNQELNAIKDHSSILEKQNYNLYNEIEGIVISDENVRQSLDRR